MSNARSIGNPQLSRWQQYVLCAIAVTLLSAIYLRYDLPNFRISTSIMVLPVLLLTLVADYDRILVCSFSAAILLFFRTLFAVTSGTALQQAFFIVLPGCLYYVCYGVLFQFLVRVRSVSLPRWQEFAAFFLCDFVSNLFEVGLDTLMGQRPGTGMIGSLILIALTRALCACLLLALYCQYRSLLTRAEHEERYQRLYLMKTRLHSELYFISKDKSSIENTVKSAYRLYEKLAADPEVSKETSHLALQIACDIHDLKKDYIRIEQGFYEELGDNGRDDRAMYFSNVMRILEDSTNRLLGDSPIRLKFSCGQDFLTAEHYALMSILRCLVNNSTEALQNADKAGTISVEEKRDGNSYLFTVTDDGPGISPKHMERIFQMGFSTKFNAATGNLYRGMGLPNVKMVTEEQLKGTLTVESTPGTLTRFIIRIPADILEVPQ